MTPAEVASRRAVEALRAGVPSRAVVERLGTTHGDVEHAFSVALDALAQGEPTEPIVVTGNFGTGKSHLLEFTRYEAQKRGCVTSAVTVGPETPLSRPGVVLEAISEAAEIRGMEGDLRRSLSASLRTDSDRFADLRLWPRNNSLHDRFAALLHLYEEWQDDEDRQRILADLTGKTFPAGELKKRLREIRQLAGYDLRKAPHKVTLPHPRILVQSQFYRACKCSGWVIFFDELERLRSFNVKQRMLAYSEIAWWAQVARTPGSGILPVFATTGALADTVRTDLGKGYGSGSDSAGASPVRSVIALLDGSSSFILSPPTPEQSAELQYKVRDLYREAFGEAPETIVRNPAEVYTDLRREIRQWITRWDLQRLYPDYTPEIQADELEMDSSEVPDEMIREEQDNDMEGETDMAY